MSEAATPERVRKPRVVPVPLDQREALTVNEVAALTRIKLHVLYAEIGAGRLKARKYPETSLRITRAALDEWLNSQPQA